MKAFIQWLASFFDESKPQSFSRLITLVIVVFIIGWDTATVRWTHQTIPGTLLLEQMAAASTFYVVRRVIGAVSKDADSPRNGQ
jgi:hypothetical protein